MQYKHHRRISKLYAHLRDYTIFVILVVAGFLIIFGFITVAQNSAQQAALDKQTALTNKLLTQVKDLTTENQKIAQTAADYAYCNAVILARYTQTGDPITVEDLDKCKFTSYPTNQVTPSLSTDGITPLDSTIQTGNADANTSSQDDMAQNSTDNTSPPNSVPTVPSVQAPTPAPTTPIVALQSSPLLPGISLYAPCIELNGILQLLLACR